MAAALASAASAFKAFLCASFSARLRASRERVDVEASRASRIRNQLYVPRSHVHKEVGNMERAGNGSGEEEPDGPADHNR